MQTKERRHWPGGVGGRKEMGTFEAERRVDAARLSTARERERED
jgi:hypothetical protein